MLSCAMFLILSVVFAGRVRPHAFLRCGCTLHESHVPMDATAGHALVPAPTSGRMPCVALISLGTSTIDDIDGVKLVSQVCPLDTHSSSCASAYIDAPPQRLRQRLRGAWQVPIPQQYGNQRPRQLLAHECRTRSLASTPSVDGIFPSAVAVTKQVNHSHARVVVCSRRTSDTGSGWFTMGHPTRPVHHPAVLHCKRLPGTD